MKLKQQVVSLELAQKLKELKVKQESLFWWCNFGREDWRGPYSDINGEYFRYPQTPGPYEFSREECSDFCSAFTSSELGEMLPREVKGHELVICPAFKEGAWFVGYGDHMNMQGIHVEDADTLADAMAKCLIYLLEQALLTL